MFRAPEESRVKGIVSRTLSVLCLAMFAAGGALSQAGWVKTPSGTSSDLVAVYFTTPDNGWVAGDNGYLASTSDGGRSWKTHPLNMTEDINEIYFRNEKNGYLVAGRK
ncbi:MAG: YCF48-related protein, partial [Pyrinomonadaceae bacterium]